MSAKLIIEPKNRRLIHYIQDIEKGLLQIPPFQRDKVWDNNKRKELFESLKEGYPIGSILLWKPEDVIFEDSINKVGPYTINIDKTKEFLYILDGFQRLSTLFGCLINPEKTILNKDEEERKKEFNLYYDLEQEEFFIPRPNSKLGVHQVPVYELIDTKASYEFERQLRLELFTEDKIEVYRDRYERLGSTLIDYTLPSIEIRGGQIDEAVNIFSRLNSKGSIISPDWMVSALSYNKDNDGFRLGSEIDNLFEELKIYGFSGLKRELILQCIVNSFGKAPFDQMSKGDTRKIESLVKRPDFVDVTKNAIEGIKKAVKFLFEELLVVDSKLLPYNNQLVFVADFFIQVENPKQSHLNKLKDWFWITTYCNYFTIYSLSQQREAYKQFQKFLIDENQDSIFNDKPENKFETIDFPQKLFFGSVRAKALLLFMLNYSNDFKFIKVEDVEGFYINYLFYNIKDEKGNFYPESAINMLNMKDQRITKTKDMIYMLEKYNIEFERYFLTSEMSEIYYNDSETSKSEILKIRKQKIISKERAFVEDLGLIYLD